MVLNTVQWEMSVVVTVTLPACLVLLYQQMLPVLVLLMAAGRVTHLNVSANHARKYKSILYRKLIYKKTNGT